MGFKVLGTVVEGADASTLRQTLDHCKNKLRSGVVLLAAVEGDKIALVSGVTSDLTDRLRAGDIMKEFAGRLGGKGGGRPDMAQGGGSDVGALAPALADLAPWITKQLEA
jgi:alanyl-tRNA synthetase